MSTKLYPSHLLLAIVVLLSIGAWAGCHSTDEPGAGAAGPSITATATADLIIVERGTPRLTRVQPVPRHVILSSGETIGMSAVAFDQEGRQIKGVSFNWQGVDPEVGSITSSGVLRAGFTKGTFKDALVVTAQPPAGMGPGLVQGTASVTVAEFDVRLPPTRVRVFPEKLEVETSGTYRLVALAVDANGVAIPNMKFKWEVLEPGLPGTIAQNGQFTASKSAGQYLDAIRVTLVPQAGVAQAVSTGVDVHVLDPRSASSRISATVLPQVISIRPGEQMRYTAMLLDRRGQQITPVEPRWEMLDSGAGSISSSGRFAAGEVPGIYSDTILVSMGAKGAEGLLTARGTVIIVEPALLPSPEPAGLARVAIFPERVSYLQVNQLAYP